MGNELPQFSENTGTPPEYDYSKVFVKASQTSAPYAGTSPNPYTSGTATIGNAGYIETTGDGNGQRFAGRLVDMPTPADGDDMSERFLDKVFQAFEDVAVQQEQSAPIVPADGDDMTWDESTLSRDTAIASELSLSQIWEDEGDLDDDGYLSLFIELRAQKRVVERLQNELHGLAAQVVELRERLERWEADS